MGKFVEIEFQNKTTLVKLCEIRLLELAEEEDGLVLTIYMNGDEHVTVEAEKGDDKVVRSLYASLRQKLEAL
jgi:hypothetical protein